MSHLKERSDKDCLNCNARVYGRYCHVCGQENTETEETAWHLITHFFNDITHFDGKFFSSLKLLFFKPGFLSNEYRMGRRASYLNPVRMYIFTSFVFFLVFFSQFQVDEKQFEFKVGKQTMSAINKMDSTDFIEFTKALNNDKPMTREVFREYVDSLRSNGGIVLGGTYKSRAAYDSAIETGKVKDGWFRKNLAYKGFELNEKYKNSDGKLFANLFSILMHNFPTLLFVSLPLFAWFLKLIYYGKKDYLFVSHGIYAIHLYIVYFIVLLAIIFLSFLSDKFHWSFKEILMFVFFMLLLMYEYKAMRNFYMQGRLKTIMKFVLAIIFRLAIIFILFIFFLIFSFLKV